MGSSSPKYLSASYKKRLCFAADGSKIKADLVLLSVGVLLSLQLAKDAGLAIGETGGLLVDEFLQTNDEAIFAAGDMNEITNTISQKKQRVPLAGPANRQGRIAAENALGGKKRYKGSAVSSIVKVFKAHAGSTGLSLKQAKKQALTPMQSLYINQVIQAIIRRF